MHFKADRRVGDRPAGFGLAGVGGQRAEQQDSERFSKPWKKETAFFPRLGKSRGTIPE